jgi:hypothetical protein
VSHGSEPDLPAGEGSSAATRPAAPSGSWAPNMKGIIAGSTKHLRLARSQGAHGYSATVACKGRTRLASTIVTVEADKTCGQIAIVQCQPLQAIDHH